MRLKKTQLEANTASTETQLEANITSKYIKTETK